MNKDVDKYLRVTLKVVTMSEMKLQKYNIYKA